MKKKIIILLFSSLILVSCSKGDNDYKPGDISVSSESKSEGNVNGSLNNKNATESKLEPNKDNEITKTETKSETKPETIKFEIEKPSLQQGKKVYSQNAKNEDLQKIGSLLKHLLQVDEKSKINFDELINTLNTLNVEYEIKDFKDAWEYVPFNGDGLFASGTNFYEITDTHINVKVAPVVALKEERTTLQAKLATGESPKLLKNLRDYSRSEEAFKKHGITARFKYGKLSNGKYKLKLENKWWMMEQ